MFSKTTKGIYIGKPEAEAESINQHYGYSRLFRDYMNIDEKINNGCFIISGRKGAGKSAYANWLLEQSKSSETLFCSIFKKDELDLEKVINSPSDKPVQFDALFEWIILVRFVRMILDSNVGTYLSQYKALKDFYNKNSGLVEIDKYDISEILSDREINFSALKQHFGFFSGFKSKMIKAPFYQMITPLRGTIKQMLSMDIYRERKFFVLFDDLDIGFKLQRENDRKMLLDLVRVSKRYNTDYLAGTSAKVLLFIRDDIANRLEGTDCDVNKIFSSYQFCINWYPYISGQRDLKQSLLRQFINQRIELAFKQKGYNCNKEDPWSSFVQENEQRGQFRYVLDHTFYTPRDLITIFKDIDSKDYSIPLSYKDLNILLREYSKIKKREIVDELVALYDKATIDELLGILKDVAASPEPFTYNDIITDLRNIGLDEEDLNTLVDYSLLVPVDKSGYKFFIYRNNTLSGKPSDYDYSVPKVLITYFSTTVWH